MNQNPGWAKLQTIKESNFILFMQKTSMAVIHSTGLSFLEDFLLMYIPKFLSPHLQEKVNHSLSCCWSYIIVVITFVRHKEEDSGGGISQNWKVNNTAMILNGTQFSQEWIQVELMWNIIKWNFEGQGNSILHHLSLVIVINNYCRPTKMMSSS